MLSQPLKFASIPRPQQGPVNFNGNAQQVPLLWQSNPQQPPFSSAVLPQITQTLQENKTAEKQADSNKKKKELLATIGPVLMLLGGVAWMGKMLPESVVEKLFGSLSKRVGQRPTQFVRNNIIKLQNKGPQALQSKVVAPYVKRLDKKLLQKSTAKDLLDRIGRPLLGMGGLFVNLNGIAAGIVSGQPSMILNNVIGLIPSGMNLFSITNRNKHIAATLEMFLGGLFTLGFANEIHNKKPGTPADEIRRYNMDHLKSIFRRDSGLGIGERIGGLFGEAASMTAFAIGDHVRLLKQVPQDFKRLLHLSENYYQAQPGTVEYAQSQREGKAWLKEASADKSRLAMAFMYAGSLPILLMSRKNPSIDKNIGLMALKGIGMMLANLSLFTIALNRDDIKGKSPLLGVPMAVAGMAMSGKAQYIGMGKVGEGVSNLFFSDIAVNGLKTEADNPNKKVDSNLIDSNKNTPVINPFQNIELTKQGILA